MKERRPARSGQSRYEWYLAGEVFHSSFSLTDLERDGIPEMLVGQGDGLLLGVNLEGRIVRRIDLGEEVLAVGSLDTPQGLLLLASTASGTHCFDVAGKPLGVAPLVAQRIIDTTHGGRPPSWPSTLTGEWSCCRHDEASPKRPRASGGPEPAQVTPRTWPDPPC
jgi:hypothetical protein